MVMLLNFISKQLIKHTNKIFQVMYIHVFCVSEANLVNIFLCVSHFFFGDLNRKIMAKIAEYNFCVLFYAI